MAKQSYYEQLRDPRWQKKRLEIMERDKFTCSDCGDNTKTLNVHHSFYQKELMLWEYQNHELSTLCETCHLQRHSISDDILCWLGVFDLPKCRKIQGFVWGMGILTGQLEDTKPDAWGDHFIYGILTAYGLNHEDAESACDYLWATSDGTIGHSIITNAIETFRKERAEALGLA